MSTDDRLESLERDGYVVIEEAVPSALIDEIRAELSPWLQGQNMGRNDFEGLASERVYALLAKAPSVAKLVEHEEVLALLDPLLPADFLLSAAIAIKLHPGETPQAFHADALPDKGVSAIWACDDFTNDNGATEVIPGSHLWEPGRRPSEGDAVKVTMPKGSVVVFVGNLLHRSGPNASDSTRLAITPQYCHPLMRQIENLTLAVPPAVARQYSDRVQALLGYSVCAPFIGYVDGLHPKRLIDPSYRGRKYRADLPSS
jgi:ectoine hydroxylase-related dioxygenase (phytanoyl-CoA dioxygenase family)